MATPGRGEVRASQLLRSRSVWALPLLLASVLVVLMTGFYFGALVDPAAHLHGLPVVLVDQDRGAASASGEVNLGDQVAAGLTRTKAITERLAISRLTLARGRALMNRDGAYAMVVIPSDFTSSTLALVAPGRAGSTGGTPTIELLANDRAGTLGVSLAEAVLEPALGDASRRIGRQLLEETSPESPARALLADPVRISESAFRPLPSHAAVGLSAFYLSLLIMMCGFLGAVIVNTSIDANLGYASTDLGPFWHQLLPRPITRWQTLLAKWVVALPSTLVLTGLLLAVSVGLLHMDAPNWLGLWMFGWFAAATIAVGTLALFASLGAGGQFLALLMFVYLGLASSGGTVPLQALNGFFQFVATFEPMRQILGAVRALLYFDGSGAAGLDRGLVLTAIGMVVWILVGSLVTSWYDRHGFHRLGPEVAAFLEAALRARPSGPAEGGPGAAGPTSPGDASPPAA